MDKVKYRVVVVCFVIVCIIIFAVTYNLRLAQIDKEVAETAYQEVDSELGISSLSVIVDGVQYDVDSFSTLDEIPVVVDVRVIYEDGTDITKQAYVVYDDVEVSSYADGDFGKLILPRK